MSYNSIRGCVRPSVGLLVGQLVGWSVGASPLAQRTRLLVTGAWMNKKLLHFLEHFFPRLIFSSHRISPFSLLICLGREKLLHFLEHFSRVLIFYIESRLFITDLFWPRKFFFHFLEHLSCVSFSFTIDSWLFPRWSVLAEKNFCIFLNIFFASHFLFPSTLACFLIDLWMNEWINEW